MHWVDGTVLLVYFGGITVAGLFFAARNRTTDGYFLGNRNFPAWAIGLSMVGTSISSVSFLAYPGDAFKTAWLRMVPNLMLPVGILIASIWILPFFRRGNHTSAFEYLEERFGPFTRVYGAVAFITAQMVRISLILYLVSILVHEFTQWPPWLCIALGGIFVSFYTVAGGMEAVVWTDVVQTIVLAVGGVLCLVIIVHQLPGGLGQIFSEAREAGKLRFAEFDAASGELLAPSWDFSLTRKTALMMLLVGLTNWLAEYSSNQNVVQRYCASRSIQDARKAMWICCFSSIPLWAFFMFLGTALWVFFQQFPTPETAAMLNGEAKAEQVLPFFILNHLPMGLAGLVVAAVLAAAMSSLDSSINAIATVGVVDIYRRHLAKDRSDRHYLMAARIMAVATSAIMILGALAFVYGTQKTLQDTATVLTALTAGGLLGLFMLGFTTTRGDDRSILAAIAATIAFTAYRTAESFSLVPPLPIDAYYTGIFGHALMFALGYTLAALLPSAKRDLTNLTLWTQGGARPEDR